MAAYLLVVGGPVYQTIGKRGGLQSTFVHVQGALRIGGKHDTTKIVHYKNWDGRLHTLVAHPGKVTADP